MERDVKCFFGESFFAFLMKPMLPLFWFSRAEWVICSERHVHCLKVRRALTCCFLLLIRHSPPALLSFDRASNINAQKKLCKSRSSKSVPNRNNCLVEPSFYL